MLFKSTLLALGATAAVASPLYRRQDANTTSTAADSSMAANATSTVTDSALQTTAATTVTSATATGSEAVSSAESAISSVASDAATGTSSAPAPTATSADNSTSTEAYAFGCPDGYSLTYVVGINSYPEVNITDAYSALQDWGTAIPPPIMSVNSSGSGEGAMRTWEVMNLTVTEMLNNVTTNETSGYLNQNWNLTSPITVSPSVIISNATSDLTLYSNSTTEETTVQFYVNFCVSDQMAGLTLYAELATAYLTGLNALFTNSTMSGNTTMAGSSTMMSSSMMPSSSSMMSSSATDSASSVASSATDAAGTASSGLSSVASTGVAGASSVASVATSGAGGALSSGLSGASSVVGDVTSALLPSSSA